MVRFFLSGFVALVTTAAALAGGYVGYANAGIGGGILYAGIAGFGGLLTGRLMARTVLLLGWKSVAVTTLLLAAAVLTWDVYL